MGHKIFVSYKYADDQVKNLDGQSNSTARDYVDKLEDYFDSSSHIYKGEKDGEDLSQLEEDTIWSKLRDRIFDSTMTIIFISPGMKVAGESEKDQWIPWEVSFSLRTTTRKSKTAILTQATPMPCWQSFSQMPMEHTPISLRKRTAAVPTVRFIIRMQHLISSVRTCSTALLRQTVCAITDRLFGLESILILPASNGAALFRP